MKKKIPEFKTEETTAAFWDNHDFIDYIEDTEPIEDVVFERPKKETVSIRLEKGQINEIKRLSHKIGLGYSSLIRSWIIEKLANIHRLQKDHTT